jgi:hypothetical protein
VDDVGHNFHSIFVGAVPSLALLTEICNLADLALFAHFLGEPYRDQTGSLSHLCHFRVQCLDPAESLERPGILRQFQAFTLLREMGEKSLQHVNPRVCFQFNNSLRMLPLLKSKCFLR